MAAASWLDASNSHSNANEGHKGGVVWVKRCGEGRAGIERLSRLLPGHYK